ncbi:hypothetical protein PN497_11880 [Sphaerospermopsis kisseleviana CS-549]|uniref:Uncharacterized protein n=2 Tax=Sphaerospermopsis TaxID=752201 RepID=A0A479ZW54_9CYAN|nr:MULTISPECIES: hypothetical protein [Sphaerospermopsis]MBD2135221.1 hypothetical protein [Sphaerospermopsis sp. FACHB-1094]MDB9442054.1 hypothetical protein [Sphaerospermopsis kisseleviana CS-549]BAZ83811.1 hypothetical protein NIES73_51000 [Sphaerospermopsis kisseleviana NIES-73]GCL35753.1 hypothetical protein SR1949_08510 [Sphaerospermopsis reniformis]
MTTTIAPKPNQHYRLSLAKAIQDYKDGIITATGLVYYAVGIFRAPGQKLRIKDVEVFCEKICISVSTFYKAISKLKEQGRIDWLEINSRENMEFIVRDNLKSQLGGLTKVTTPAGRIDLLTDTEIIEVKRVKDWKAGLGQVLIYSGFYPEHQKRLHLFGTAEYEQQIPNIAASCVAFDVLVTFDQVTFAELGS